MGLDLIRYYFYLQEEEGFIAEFQSKLKDAFYQPPYSSAENIPALNYSRQFNHGNMRILVIRLAKLTAPPDGCAALLQDLETAARLTAENLLGKVTVWASYGEDYPQLKTALFKNKPAALDIQMINGHLARPAMYWPGGHAQYLCVLASQEDRSEKFLTNSLPLIEAGFLQLNLIDKLYRERHIAIDNQTRELDKHLSMVLHTDLVARQSQLKQVDELESQLSELGKAYGIIAGNKNIIVEGINKIKLQIASIGRKLEAEKTLLLTPETSAKLLSPFKLRLDNLARTLEALDICLHSHQAAIEVVESKVQIMNSRQNIATQEKIRDLLELNATMQKQSLIFQISAAAIEFIVIAYYSHSLWKALAPVAYHAAPGWIQFILVLLFSGNVVYCTHLVGEYIQDKKDKQVKKNLLISLIPLLLLLIFVLVGSYLLGNTSAH